MKVAVAYNNGQIGEHFGHAECFAIYDYQDTNVDSCVKKLIDCTDRHGHQAMTDLMRENDVDAVIVSQMGDEAPRSAAGAQASCPCWATAAALTWRPTCS